MRRIGGGDIAAGARLVLDDDRLAERRREPFGDHPRLHVGAAAGREGDDEGERMARPIVGACRYCKRTGCKNDGETECEEGCRSVAWPCC